MQRNRELEKEMQAIAEDIWKHIGNQRMPRIESKRGGPTGAYYVDEHTVRIRWNVWHHLTLAGKRLLMIHELYHARGEAHHERFNNASDLISLAIDKRIWGEDDADRELVAIVDLEVARAFDVGDE